MSRMGNFLGEIEDKIPIFHSMAPFPGDPLLFPTETSVACNGPVGSGADFSPVLKDMEIAEMFGRPESIMALGSPATSSWCACVSGGHRTFRSWVVGARSWDTGTCHLRGHPGTLRFCSQVPLLPWPLQDLPGRIVSAVRPYST